MTSDLSDVKQNESIVIYDLKGEVLTVTEVFEITTRAVRMGQYGNFSRKNGKRLGGLSPMTAYRVNPEELEAAIKRLG